ncbi:uncharacterized protein LOC103943989 isoform X2 [Pyrus x bretschneideri]|uniref:uncharacterized protein LOC103943989 isoform X2 n=1 Tax=Pyrus x bretschneideri TaxID=225117 RepID=UPI00202E82CC|nr:uncharacterized protein LOC103943989 isoform X2 [Pyrus x bretschneideri]
MPGTIKVSVLEFIDLPSSSISIKVSMGQRECQAWDKGDFTFVLTSLRDNLVVLLQDSEGNEISHAGVEVKSIVEKGLWEDLFPLNEGGFVRMKLQFVLNEEERNRIRMMRESALKKKQGELINSSTNSVQSTLSAGVNVVASSLNLREESDADRNKETSSANTLHQSVELPVNESYEGRLVEKAEPKQLPANVPSTATSADTTSIVLRGSQSAVGATNHPNLQEDRPRNLEKQGPIKTTPISVKKMISAFESGSAEDVSPRIKSPPIQVRSNKIKTGALVESQNLEEHKNVISTETTQSISKAIEDPFRSGDLNLDLTSGEKIGHQISFGASDAIKSSHPTGIKNKFKQLDVHQVADIKKGNFPKDFVRPSAFETVQVLEKILGKHRHEPSDMPHGKQPSGGIKGIEESRVKVSSTNTQITDVQGPSCSANVCTSEANLEDRHIQEDSGPNVLCTSVANCEDRHIPFESSGAWIFPDEAIRFCVTTTGKKMIDSRGRCRENPNIHQRETNFSLPENVEEHNVDKNEENQRRRSKVENSSEEAGTFGGPFGQAIKVAIMIGFGTLVLLTRQRKNS